LIGLSPLPVGFFGKSKVSPVLGKHLLTFKDRVVVNLLGGEPEYLDPLKDEAPAGWIVTGYPWNEVATPENKAFVAAYQNRTTTIRAWVRSSGYLTIKSLAAGIAKAGSTDTEKLVDAFRGLKLDGPFGPFEFRASDHQATLGAFVGKLALKDGRGTMADFKYVDGASVLPSEYRSLYAYAPYHRRFYSY
jgi:branched-chain amino acid transport system substrate-binding protein